MFYMIPLSASRVQGETVHDTDLDWKNAAFQRRFWPPAGNLPAGARAFTGAACACRAALTHLCLAPGNRAAASAVATCRAGAGAGAGTPRRRPQALRPGVYAADRAATRRRGR